MYYLVQRGQLPAVQIGGRWRVKKDLLDSEILTIKKRPLKTKTAKGIPKILLVDDQADILELLSMALSAKGYESETVETGNGAVEKLKSAKYDIMFLDLNLPDIMGEEVFEKAIEIQPDVHVVVMTGVATVRNLEKILALGPVTVLQKPFKMDQLLHITKVLLGEEEK